MEKQGTYTALDATIPGRMVWELACAFIASGHVGTLDEALSQAAVHLGLCSDAGRIWHWKTDESSELSTGPEIHRRGTKAVHIQLAPGRRENAAETPLTAPEWKLRVEVGPHVPNIKG